MSAMNVIVTESAAHVFTDGASYNSKTGVVEGLISKCALLPQCQAVVAITGIPAIRMLLEGLIGDRFGQDEFDLVAERLHEEVTKEFKLRPQWFNSGAFELLLVGWSKKRGGPKAYHLAGHREGTASPFEPRAVRKFLSPHPIAFGEIEFDESRAAECGLAIMERQRRQSYSPVGSIHEFYAIGGFCQHTIVREHELTTSVIRRWPDKIGEAINPRSEGS